ncbi:MAG: type I-E CRISPR-associated protein Cas6/Cse3/CasE, partial [Acidimicrobiales bacterium]
VPSLNGTGIDSKPMPVPFREGTELGFETRVCPVVRTKRQRDGLRTKSGERELDVFLLEVEKHPETMPGTLDKTTIYEAWFKARFDELSGASLHSVQLTALRRERVLRREKGAERKVRAFDRPDAVFSGRFLVNDPMKFQAFLGHGLGRHRAFGFGMLLLRPSR